MITGQGVLSIESRDDNNCSNKKSENACTSHSGCGWAQGHGQEEMSCLTCEELERWCHSQLPPMNVCTLEAAPRFGTHYLLTGCGCGPAPEPDWEPQTTGSIIRNILATVLPCGGASLALLLYRASRRAAQMREMYGIDIERVQ